MKFKFRPLTIAVTAAVAIFGSLALLLIFSDGEQSFPAISVGAYGGKISGLGKNRDLVHTLFVERLRKRKALLAVVFSSGAKPQIVALKTKPRVKGEQVKSEKKKSELQPVKFRYRDQEYELAGKLLDGGGSGKVYLDGEALGTWSLYPLDGRDLREDISIDSAKVNLANWLDLQSIGQLLRQSDVEATKQLEKKQQTYGKLANFVNSKESLISNAELRKQDLSEEVIALETERTSLLVQLQSAVRRLEQLTRITRRGQTIDLARRVAKREHKWYEVNWQIGADLTVLEEGLAEQMNVDLTKLRQGVKQGEEYQRLQATIAKERADILELQKVYRRSIEQRNQEVSNDRQPPADPSKPWWRKWETIFE